MRGLSLIVLVIAVLVVGYLNLRSVEEHAPASPNRDSTANQVKQQVEDTLQQYQQRLDQQAESN